MSLTREEKDEILAIKCPPESELEKLTRETEAKTWEAAADWLDTFRISPITARDFREIAKAIREGG